MVTRLKDNGNYIEHLTITDLGEVISRCKVNIYPERWQVSTWNTKPEYQHMGYGRKAFAEIITHCLCQYGTPRNIQYTWNGLNHYVKDWMTEHFHAKCICPIEVLKYSNDDVWKSHVYELNVEEVIKYALST